MNITAESVRVLREQTGAGMMDCKSALVEAQGDMNKAQEVLRKKGLAAAAKRAGRDQWDMMFDLVQAGGVQVAPETMDEAQKRLALQQPWMMVETDTPPVNPAKARSTHPRAFGAFPRVLAKYSREEKVLTLEDAIRRMTSMQASLLGLHDRGLIAEGMAADLVLFDPDKIQDRATFERPLQYATGVDYLLINGVPVIDNGGITGALPGRVLRHGGADVAVAP